MGGNVTIKRAVNGRQSRIDEIASESMERRKQMGDTTSLCGKMEREEVMGAMRCAMHGNGK